MIALVYSYLYVLFILAISATLYKLDILNDEASRKLIHIGVGNWIIIAYYLFDNIFLALIPPLSFIFLNWLSYRFHLVKAMERETKTTNDLGTVYYAISLFILILADFLAFGKIELSILPILLMAYGDGLSAVIGQRFQSKRLIAKKSLYGSLTMFVVSVLLSLIMGYGLIGVLVISVISTIAELFTPKGFDNLTVPLLIYVVLLSGIVV